VTATERAAIAAAFEEIRKPAEAGWQELWRDRPVVMVGAATCGRAAGALDVLKAFREEIDKRKIDCPVIEVGCMGHCYAEPIAIISKPGWPPICYGYVNPVIAERLVNEFILGENPCPEFVIGTLGTSDILPSFQDFPRAQYEQKIILKNCGHIDPTEIGHYIANGGYAALAKALQKKPVALITEIKKSRLRGRGGGPFLQDGSGSTAARLKGHRNTSFAMPTKATRGPSSTGLYSKATPTLSSREWLSPGTPWALATAISTSALSTRWR
jgi:(2Fe-2S) ferredoxin